MFSLSSYIKMYQNTWLSPCWSVLEFWKIKLEKSILTNWIFSLQKSILKLIFAGYTFSKNQVWNRLKIRSVELDFSKLIFQKSSTDNRGSVSKITKGPKVGWEKGTKKLPCISKNGLKCLFIKNLCIKISFNQNLIRNVWNIFWGSLWSLCNFGTYELSLYKWNCIGIHQNVQKYI